jgi:uncharacterized protein YuzE
MKVIFVDTDTAQLQVSDGGDEENREISEDVYADLDKNGRLGSWTIEHAGTLAKLPEVFVQQVGGAVA